MLARLVRILNMGLALLVVLVAICIYWYAVRPLPKTSGEIEAPISHRAVIRRDERGIPHIQAASWQDAIFLQGFVTAQDRLWQMDVLRRFGSGELAAVFGAVALSADEQARRMRMREIAENDALHLRPQDRAVLVEYARGVNYFIRSNRGRYSLEFSLPTIGYDPREWSVADSLAVGLVMFRNLSDSAQFELDKGEYLAASRNHAHARVLFPPLQGRYVSPGSNAWAVSGEHSSDGKPLLANDPHLEYGIPPTWYLVHMQAPGLNVSGASLPGVPCVITGHNEQIAWGVTNVQADVMDLYREQIDERSGRYSFRGATEQAQLDQQLIAVKGRQPVTLRTWVTRHGPTFRSRDGHLYSMRWTATEGFALPFFDLDRARNWDEFRAGLRGFVGPAQNFVYADRAGNIGFQVTGKLPIRRNFDGDVPLDGASGEFEWDGFIPFDELPTFYNPPSGMVATANQNPFPPTYPYRVDGSFHDKYRIDQIRTRLAATPKLTVKDMLAIQKDVYSGYDYFLAKQVLHAAGGKHGGASGPVQEALEVLRTWNGQMDKDEAAPTITQLLSAHLGESLVTAAAGGAMGTSPAEGEGGQQTAIEKTAGGHVAADEGQGGAVRSRNLPAILPRPEIIERLLRTRPTGWVANDDWDGWLLSNLTGALAEGRKLQGSRIAKWRWGQMMQWTFGHPIGKQLPVVAPYFDIGPVPMSGSGMTVKQTTRTLGPSERMVADTGDWDRSVQNLTTGESGFVASSHYKDEWGAYYLGKSFPMEWDHVSAKQVLTVEPLTK